jgi:hypothetical protein
MAAVNSALRIWRLLNPGPVDSARMLEMARVIDSEMGPTRLLIARIADLYTDANFGEAVAYLPELEDVVETARK